MNKNSNKIIELNCQQGCCNIFKTNYKSVEYSPNDNWKEAPGKIKKAGCLIFDPKKNKILLVLSRNFMWGCPKGSIELNESIMDGAIREVKEETGLDVHPDMFLDSAVIFTKNMYYLVHLPETPIEVQRDHIQSIYSSQTLSSSTPIVHNDVNGLMWVHPECLRELVESNQIHVNRNTKILLKRFLNLSI